MERDRRRWEGDVRGTGTSDARAFVPHVDALAAAMASDGWVAEEPETHLMPKLLERLRTGDLRLRFARSHVADGLLLVELENLGGSRASEVRRDVIALVAVIAESSTFVRETSLDDPAGGRQFDVSTGSLEGDSPFAGHGHLVRIVVSRVAEA